MFLYFRHGITLSKSTRAAVTMMSSGALALSLRQVKLTPGHWSLRQASRAPLCSIPQSRSQHVGAEANIYAFGDVADIELREKPVWMVRLPCYILYTRSLPKLS